MSEYGIFSKLVAEDLGISASTLRKWSMALEQAGYQFKRNDKDQRIYYDRDINVLSKYKFLIDKSKSTEDAVKAVMAGVKDRNNAEVALSVIWENRDNEAAEGGSFEDFKKEQNEHFFHLAEIVKGLTQQVASLAEENKKLGNQLQLPQSPQEIKHQQINQSLTMWRIEKRLEEEALNEWISQPDENRFIKKGWFRVEEDLSKRDLFIKSYVNERFPKAVEEELLFSHEK